MYLIFNCLGQKDEMSLVNTDLSRGCFKSWNVLPQSDKYIFFFLRVGNDLSYYYNKDIRKIVSFVCDMYDLLDQYIRCL